MKYLITSALPYANGPLHFGHMAGVYLPADIFTRHKKLKGVEAIHISGSDEHGVAIMQNAQKAGISYQEYVNDWHKTHKDLFDKYEIQFDFFGQTSAPYHKEETLTWFNDLLSKGLIEKKAEQQLQCQSCKNMLPDRFVEGECYVCHYPEARGDECPSCGTWIDPLKLLKPVCKFCGSNDVKAVDSFQWYLMLSKVYPEWQKWFEGRKPEWRKNVVPFVESLTKENLVDRAITRDLDWGIDVPLPEAKGKKIYVWFDAPIGYVSNTKEYLKQSGSKDDHIKDWWGSKDVKIVNFIGKDNIIFHSIIFPVMCLGTGFVNPVTDLPANQYVNLEGKQFSKSKGWYVDAVEAINQFGSDAMRFYLTSLIPETSDSSFTWKSMELKINSELANNIGNFINRAMKFSASKFPEGVEAQKFEAFFKDHVQDVNTFIKEYHELLDSYQIKKGQEHIMGLGSKVNQFITERAPWTEFKTDPEKAKETIAISTAYVLVIGTFFAPYLPQLSKSILSYFGLNAESELVKKIYQGDLNAMKDFFAKDFKLQVEPQGLVPKIDPKVIEELDLKLKEKASV
ncbi:methionine--tRNA ligase [Peredibacter starrii]|uniref:Methionine--tRNA ligase n=1 Tax=Peredibacter starrii TaxID=28202 RepID=A0AAX4HSL9_9BACT|nr:methionine--tRNA ligase [Peredibacter starrii]WPU66370.1 methionine--tRNA ligase [Peredibacter starrii]